MLNEVAKHAALELAWRLYRKGKVKPDGFGKKWYTLAQDLLKAWMDKLATSLTKDIFFKYAVRF